MPTGSFTFTLPAGTFFNPSCGAQNGNTFVVSVVTTNIGASNGTATATCTFTLVPLSTTSAVGTNNYSVTYSGDNQTLSTAASLLLNVVQTNTATIATIVDSTQLTACSSTSATCSGNAPQTYVYGQTFTLNSV